MANKNILIIQTNKQNLKVLSELLTDNNYDVTSVESHEEFTNLDDVNEFHLVLVSSYTTYLLPKDIMTLLDEKFPLAPPVVFIESSKEHNRKMLLECYEAGAVDYIKKPFDSKEIIARIDSHVKQFLKLCEYKLRVDKLAQLATVDQLSKFSSKMHMQAILKHQVDLSSRHQSKLSIFYLRLLDTNKVVGAFGFDYGEKLIASFSKELKKNLRESDVVARWSGPDFIILLPYTDEKTSEIVAKKLISELHPVKIMKEIKPDIAIGITQIESDDTIKSIIDKSKNAMEEASKMRYGKISMA